MARRPRAAREDQSLAATPLDSLSGVGPKMSERLARLGLHSLADLLFHLPLRYEDRTRRHPIGALEARTNGLIAGEVQVAQIKYGRRRSLLVRVADGTGYVDLRFFHFGNPLRETLRRGVRVQCYGELRRGPAGLEMVHPELKVLKEDEAPELDDRLLPVYPTTDGLTQAGIRKLTTRALARARAGGHLDELLPDALVPPACGLPLLDAVELLHYPPPDNTDELKRARERLSFEELLANQLSHRAVRAQLGLRTAPRLTRGASLRQRLLDSLPFKPTGAQTRVVSEILADITQARPMYRLVQGDVGSGKTLVAALAAASACESTQQTAIMAPTELLAEQHMRQFSAWFEPLGVRVAWMGGRQTARSRRDTLAALASGEAHIAVGTHALFQDAVRFARLGLVVIDEQHRFGVHQRHALLNKSADPAGELASGSDHDHDAVFPHQLIMTATPIPRTLQMTAYAHLDISTIDELPPGRQQVDTAVLPDSRRDEIVARIAAACAAGQQAYWVCPLIEESEAIEAEAAEATAATLAEALPGLRVGLVHGRMKSTERDALMQSFRDAEIDLLVATTVIEVGVDVPNASLMIIENAERMGLSQLHQLRGRVGRGNRKSACVLMYKGPLGRIAKERLAVLRESSDGFVIASRDLALRGPGEVLGTRQTGEQQFRVADPARDEALMDSVLSAADHLLERGGDAPARLVERWVGSAVQFGEVG